MKCGVLTFRPRRTSFLRAGRYSTARGGIQMEHGRARRWRPKHRRLRIAASAVLFAATVAMVASTLAVQPASAALVPALHGTYTTAQLKSVSGKGNGRIRVTQFGRNTIVLVGGRVLVPGCPISDLGDPPADVGVQFAIRGAIVARYGSFDSERGVVGDRTTSSSIKGRITSRGTIVGTYRSRSADGVCDTGVQSFTARRVSRGASPRGGGRR